MVRRRRIGARHLLFVAVLIGCQPSSPTTAWEFALSAFAPSTLNTKLDSDDFSPRARNALIPLKEFKGEIKLQQLHEVFFDSPNKRSARLILSIDGWHVTLAITLTRRGQTWQVTDVLEQTNLAHALELLSPSGLPKIERAPERAPSLNGLDLVGRPDASVMVTAVGGMVSIDAGSSMAYEKDTVQATLRERFQRRSQVAGQVRATYIPEVAIAMRSTSPAMMTVDLINWSFDAGAKRVVIVVRDAAGRSGGLSVFPLENTHTAPWFLSWIQDRLDGSAPQSQRSFFSGSDTKMLAFSRAIKRAVSEVDTPRFHAQIGRSKNHDQLARLLAVVIQSHPTAKVGVEAQ